MAHVDVAVVDAVDVVVDVAVAVAVLDVVLAVVYMLLKIFIRKCHPKLINFCKCVCSVDILHLL